jgi:hypothetical protein
VTRLRLRSLFALLATACLWPPFTHAQAPAFIDKITDEILQRVRPAEKPKLGELLSSGRLTEVSLALNKLSLAEPDAQSAARLRELSIFLMHEDPRRWTHFRVDAPVPLSDTERGSFHVVVGQSRRLLGVTVVSARVKEFLVAYGWGFRNFEQVLDSADARMQVRIQPARQLSRDRLVTIISSGKDRELVRRRAAELEAEGNVVFSYLFCETPTGGFCSDETIGAFAAISGHVEELNTANSQKSSFVFEEADAVRRLTAGQDLVTVVSYDDLAAAAKQFAAYSKGLAIELASVNACRYVVSSEN